MQDTITLTEKQQQRIAQLLKELQLVEAQLKPLQHSQKAFQMAVQAVLSTILECANAPEDAEFRLAEDGKSLILIEQKAG